MKNTKKQLINKRYFDGHANVWLPIEVHRAMKVRAAQEGVTLKNLFEKAMNLYLKNTQPTQQ